MSIATRSEPGSKIAANSAAHAKSVISLVLPDGIRLKTTSEEFERLAAANRDLRLEMTGSGELIVMTPEGSESGASNFLIAGQLFLWTAEHGGIGFGSSAGFTFPNGAIRSPDLAWISTERWQSLPVTDKAGFARIVPDFVVELRSASDKLDDCRTKMIEYANAGVRLGWLIDPESRTVIVYRPNQEPRTLENPETVSGEDVLPGFDLQTRPIFSG
jgi:Uma2 family endonuclease